MINFWEYLLKPWYICTMEYYLAVRKKEILPFAAAWMDLESITLSEISQSEKDKYHVISLICESNEQNKLTNKIETDSQIQRTE